MTEYDEVLAAFLEYEQAEEDAKENRGTLGDQFAANDYAKAALKVYYETYTRWERQERDQIRKVVGY